MRLLTHSDHFHVITQASPTEFLSSSFEESEEHRFVAIEYWRERLFWWREHAGLKWEIIYIFRWRKRDRVSKINIEGMKGPSQRTS